MAHTNLLAARPELGRPAESREIRLIRRLSEQLTGVSFPEGGGGDGTEQAAPDPLRERPLPA